MYILKKYFSKPLNKDELGKLGEKISFNYLRKKDYHILQRNFRTHLGEIDIIARNQNQLVFVEVKTREEKLKYGIPSLAVTPAKQKRLKKIAQSYIDNTKDIIWNECRFDIIEIVTTQNGKLKSLNHIIDAFQ